eukprot:360794-Chlamydomonas_euryale.AAC.5
MQRACPSSSSFWPSGSVPISTACTFTLLLRDSGAACGRRHKHVHSHVMLTNVACMPGQLSLCWAMPAARGQHRLLEALSCARALTFTPTRSAATQTTAARGLRNLRARCHAQGRRDRGWTGPGPDSLKQLRGSVSLP